VTRTVYPEAKVPGFEVPEAEVPGSKAKVPGFEVPEAEVPGSKAKAPGFEAKVVAFKTETVDPKQQGSILIKSQVSSKLNT